MSMGGSTARLPAAGQKPMGSDLQRASTSESARPLPMLAGKMRIGLTFISDVFKTRSMAVTQTQGKQKTKSGYNYYASLAAAVCGGPVDALHDIILNGDSVYASTTVIKALTLTAVGAVATFGTKNPHGLASGQSVLIEGANELAFNGSFLITVTDPTHFTYRCIEAPSATPGTGTITARVKLDPVIRAGNPPDYVDIVIPDYGEMRLYWGSETQTADDYLQTSGIAHPAYRGTCYAVFRDLFLGFNQTNVQNIELIVARYPAAEWHGLQEIDEDVNAIAFLGDLLQNPRSGLGLAEARLDVEALGDSAESVKNEGIGISPLLMRQSDARQVLVQLMEYLDGYPTINSAGLLGLALARPPLGSVLEIVDADLTARPSFSPEDWASAISETDLKFTNREFEFKEDMRKWRDAGTRNIVGEPSASSLDRAWVTSPSVAAALVQSAGRAAAVPALTGRLRLRRRGTMFTDLVPGALFKLTVSDRTLTGQIFRVTERTWPDPARPEFEVSFKLDRTYLYTPPIPL